MAATSVLLMMMEVNLKMRMACRRRQETLRRPDWVLISMFGMTESFLSRKPDRKSSETQSC